MNFQGESSDGIPDSLRLGYLGRYTHLQTAEAVSLLNNSEARNEALKEEIRELCRFWLEVYNFAGDFTIEWTTGKADQATCEHDTEYDAALLTFNPGRIWELEPDMLRELVCHEVAHIPSWPLWEVADDLLERLVREGIARGELEQWQKAIRRAGEYATTQIHRAVSRAYNAGERAERERGPEIVVNPT